MNTFDINLSHFILILYRIHTTMLFSTTVLYHYLLEEKISYRTFLSIEDRRRRDRRVPRIALLPYHASTFEYIYISANNQALINPCIGIIPLIPTQG